MAPLVLVLLIVIALFILGAAGVVHFLLWVAIVLALLWIIGFFLRGTTGGRWYRW